MRTAILGKATAVVTAGTLGAAILASPAAAAANLPHSWDGATASGTITPRPWGFYTNLQLRGTFSVPSGRAASWTYQVVASNGAPTTATNWRTLAQLGSGQAAAPISADLVVGRSPWDGATITAYERICVTQGTPGATSCEDPVALY